MRREDVLVNMKHHLLPPLLLVALLIASCSATVTPSPSFVATPAPSPSTALPPSPAVTPSPSSSTGLTLAIAHVPRVVGTPAEAQGAGTAIDAFGFDLLHQTAVRGQNLVFSPTSIALALAMAEAGAQGATAAQMAAVLHNAGSGSGLNALDQALSAQSGTFTDPSGQSYSLDLHIANAPFAQVGLPLQPAFLDTLAAQFGAGVRLVDYQNDAEAARNLINAWVADQTAGRIPQLLAPGIIKPATRLTLVNAIYLKAPWQTPFDKGATADAPFTRADGSTVSVPTMTSGESGASYAAGTGWQAVELPYVGSSLAMTIIMPDSLATFVAQIDAAGFAQITSTLAVRNVDLYLPRFKVQTAVDLGKTLAALGMPLAFDPEHADFSGITTATRLSISAVIHQANIAVDEQGTEAAAATAVAMVGLAMPVTPLTVHIDHPFLFAVRDLASGAILFLGQVSDPSVGS